MNKKVWRILPGLLRAVGLLLGVIGVGFLPVVIIFGYKALLASDAQLLSSYSQYISYEQSLKGHDIELITSPELDTHVTVVVAESIQKHWRSNDLQFIVQDPATSRQLVRIDLSRSDDWGKVLEAKELREPAKVSFKVNLPPEIAIGSRLSGTLLGTVEYPQGQPPGFTTAIRTLNLPIGIMIVSQAELARMERSNNLSGAKRGALGVGLMLFAAVILYFTGRKISRAP